MKNQYFGDINDYRKYGLLRLLTGHGELSCVICWMLTPDDSGPDGKFTRYLEQPKKYRHFDPELFDTLRILVVNQDLRDVGAAEDSGILANTQFYSAILDDDDEARRSYFDAFHRLAEGADLVFFDPDNGLEVKSRPLGSKNSSKYLYWREAVETFRSGKSVLIYQHFRREEREAFIRRLAHEISDRLGAAEVQSFRTAHVVFFLATQEEHAASFGHHSAQVERAWRRQILVRGFQHSECPLVPNLPPVG